MPESQTPACAEIAGRLRGLREAMDFTIDDMARNLALEPEKVEFYESGAGRNSGQLFV